LTPSFPSSAPRDLTELAARALLLEGSSLGALEARFGQVRPTQKGRAGLLIERALGAHAGVRSEPDFPALGIELKTIPVDLRGRPLESTFVCALRLRDAERLDWAASAVRAKLAHVLWAPIVRAPGAAEARVGRAFFWRPTPAQERVLRADFEELVGMVALGKVEALSARVGRWLQLRPKAAHGGVRVRAHGSDGEPLWAMPRGFYLRARFTAALLRDPETLSGAS
jgi:DNA mismatch repair protein MutH